MCGREAEPRKVIEDAPLECRRAAMAVVVLHPDEDFGTGRLSNAPHPGGVQHVTEVEFPRGRRGKAGDGAGQERASLYPEFGSNDRTFAHWATLTVENQP
jgi:hypothetical protein